MNDLVYTRFGTKTGTIVLHVVGHISEKELPDADLTFLSAPVPTGFVDDWNNTYYRAEARIDTPMGSTVLPFRFSTKAGGDCLFLHLTPGVKYRLIAIEQERKGFKYFSPIVHWSNLTSPESVV